MLWLPQKCYTTMIVGENVQNFITFRYMNMRSAILPTGFYTWERNFSLLLAGGKYWEKEFKKQGKDKVILLWHPIRSGIQHPEDFLKLYLNHHEQPSPELFPPSWVFGTTYWGFVHATYFPRSYAFCERVLGLAGFQPVTSVPLYFALEIWTRYSACNLRESPALLSEELFN